MRHIRLFCFIAFLLALPIYSFGQRVPVGPSMLLDIGGSDGSVYSFNLKVDAQGNTYITGNFIDRSNTLDFDPSAGVSKLGLVSGSFIAKYSAAGALIWVKPITGDPNGLDIDQNGNITVIGQKPLRQAYMNINYLSDAFILRLDNNGNVLWEKIILAGTKELPVDPNRILIYNDLIVGYKAASDDEGNVIGVFTFEGSPEVGGSTTAKGDVDGLVVKYDPNGNVIWKFNLGATGLFNNSAIETLVDKDNNIIIAGHTDGTVNYNPLGSPVNVTADNSFFLAKYSPAGILQWVKSIKANMPRNNVKLALDAQDNIYMNGSFTTQIDFGAAPTLMSSGSQDVFIAKYSSDGNLLYHKSIGGSDAAMINGGLSIGPDNSLYLTGNFKGKVDVDPSSSAAELNSNGTIGMFVTKYDDNGNYQWAFRVPGIVSFPDIPNLDNSVGFLRADFLKFGVQDINVNSSDEIFVTGAYESTVNFNGTGCGVNTLSTRAPEDPSRWPTDVFIVRYEPTIEIPITNNTLRAPAATDICAGIDPGIIIGSIPVGDHYTYQWQQSLDNSNFTDMTGSVSKDFDPPVITETTYYRRRLVTSECAAPNISNVITLTHLQAATLNTITAPLESNFCNVGDAAQIRGSLPLAVGDVDYQWQQSEDDINFTDISGAEGIDYDPPSLTVTTFYRRLITNIPCNIGTPSNVITIAVVSVPISTVSADQTVCVGDGVTLIATGGIRYSWSPATGLSATDVESPTAKPTITTNYTVTIFNGYCTYVLTVKVFVVERPTVNAGADKEILDGDNVQLNALVSSAEGATFTWTPATGLDNPAIANPTASPTENTTYRLTVRSANGCFIVSDEVVITVRERLFIPNAFTPNADGINDVLTISGLDDYPKSLLTIFDRYGQPIFKSLAYLKPWNGTHDGKPLPSGTYYYILVLNDSEHKRLSGYISLIK